MDTKTTESKKESSETTSHTYFDPDCAVWVGQEYGSYWSDLK